MRIPHTSAPAELAMEDPTKFAELTERLLAHVEAQQETIKQMQSELSAHSAALCEMLAWLNSAEEAGAVPARDSGPDEPSSWADHRHVMNTAPERRGLPRRKGNPVSVLISGTGTDASSFQGVVVDRSPDGLCLIIEQEVPVGTRLLVRPAHNLISSDWFPIEVRSCRPELKIWIVGCCFLRRLTWSNLRLFG